MASCDQPGLMPLTEGIRKLLATVSGQQRSETVSLCAAANRVLAESVFAPAPVPGFDNSAMDGYAVRAADMALGKTFTVQGRALAGAVFDQRLKAGQVVRIMTGAALPRGADTVIIQENSQRDGDRVRFSELASLGTNVRAAGGDIQQGSRVISANTRLNAVHLALLASVGCAAVNVYGKTTVGLISTGDELTLPGETLAYGDIYNSNAPALIQMLSNLNVDIIDYGIVQDDPELFRQAFGRADRECDFVLTSGGVSVGEADYTRDILQELGNIEFWKLAIKPGKPFAFGQLPNSYFIGLPGNPVSALVTFHLLGSQAIRQHQHLGYQPMAQLTAITSEPIHKTPGRMDFQRGSWQSSAEGISVAPTRSAQGSNILTSLAHANCYIALEQERGSVKVGEAVTLWLFDDLY
ncbi:gephyrin-like molybdotransferase Glp [Reinekea sp.]|uniref:molybdopterin molybdotransferase MoeA n=1 Tax=Reinekea sp. TaxID=1970455 RepID=UPI002A80ACB3|nr:gephyrin-like molybdotransferase Glp [Reinekea sp.]